MENYIILTTSVISAPVIAITLFFSYVLWKEHREAQNQYAQRWWRQLERGEKRKFLVDYKYELQFNEAKTIRKLYKKHLRKYK